MGKKVVLLLTGTVNPNNMAFTKLQDVESRKAQYIDAIRFWIKKVDLPIVFVENSGYDLSHVFEEEVASGRLQILSFQGNNYARHLGKGYGELLILEHAYKNSAIVQQADFIFKVTGRHKILNFSTFLNQYLKCPDTHLIVNFYRFLTNCDSRFFGFVPSFIPDYLIHYQDVVNDSKDIFFEGILACAALQAISKGHNFRPLENLPRIKGSSGTFGFKYNSNYLSWLRHNTSYLLTQSIFK
ncbi:MAG: hypothetical protein INR73_09930 [Williamsia sp.]|nr:hypothetical protein [Williamsia sp.]